MGRTKDMHLRQERDRGQGWDRSLFPGNPNALTVEELRDELAKRGLAQRPLPLHQAAGSPLPTPFFVPFLSASIL